MVSSEETLAVPRTPLFGRLRGNPTGVKEAFFAFAIGLVVSSIAVAVVESVRPGRGGRGVASIVVDLLVLYACYIGAAVVTVKRSDGSGKATCESFARTFGVAIRPIDVPLGIAVGFFAQFVLVPVASLPLEPFVPHLSSRLSSVANSLTAGISTPGLVVLGVFICLFSPMFEELFFRGVLLRGLAGATGRRGVVSPRVAATAAGVASVLFGLAHFEGVQLLGLVAAGFAFATLAASTGRLGAGFVAHMTFNTLAFVSVVHLV